MLHSRKRISLMQRPIPTQISLRDRHQDGSQQADSYQGRKAGLSMAI
jgi:hypothetical protein